MISFWCVQDVIQTGWWDLAKSLDDECITENSWNFCCVVQFISKVTHMRDIYLSVISVVKIMPTRAHVWRTKTKLYFFYIQLIVAKWRDVVTPMLVNMGSDNYWFSGHTKAFLNHLVISSEKLRYLGSCCVPVMNIFASKTDVCLCSLVDFNKPDPMGRALKVDFNVYLTTYC